MSMGRGIAAGALALATLGSNPVQAQTAVFAQSGDWRAYGGLRPGEDKEPFCGIWQKVNDRYIAIRVYQGEKTFTIQIGSKQWHLDEKQTYTVSFSIDNISDWIVEKGGADPIRLPDGDAALEFDIHASQLDTFVREFRSGNQMRFTFPKIEAGGWTVSLAGSNEISDAFDRCRRVQKASPSVLGQPLQWCYGAGNPTTDQTIEGCTAVIGAGLWTGKDAAVPLGRRVLAYELKGDYEHQIADANEVVRLRPEAAVGTYFSRGRARFYQADFSAAAADFSKVLELKDEAYAMLWRFLARRRAGPEGASELAAGAAKLDGKDWPYPVVDFYLERRSADEMQAAAAKPEEKCEATFYLAEWHLLRANGAEAKPLLQVAAETCPEGFIERSGAQVELKRLGP